MGIGDWGLGIGDWGLGERIAASFPDTTLIRINKDWRELHFPGVRHYIPLSEWTGKLP